MEFTRFSETVIPKTESRVASITVAPMISDCTGTIYFTDLHLQEGDWQTGYVTHTSGFLQKYRKDGEIQPPRHYNGIVRGGDTVVIANNHFFARFHENAEDNVQFVMKIPCILPV
jgi:hypothetical protein